MREARGKCSGACVARMLIGGRSLFRGRRRRFVGRHVKTGELAVDEKRGAGTV